jgi:hypothetical protein
MPLHNQRVQFSFKPPFSIGHRALFAPSWTPQPCLPLIDLLVYSLDKLLNLCPTLRLHRTSLGRYEVNLFAELGYLSVFSPVGCFELYDLSLQVLVNRIDGTDLLEW